MLQRWLSERRRSPRGGRPPVDDREAFAGIVYRLRTGCHWDAIASEFGSGSTCYRRFVEWCEANVFEKLHAERKTNRNHQPDWKGGPSRHRKETWAEVSYGGETPGGSAGTVIFR